MTAALDASPQKSTTGRSIQAPRWLRTGLWATTALAPSWGHRLARTLYFKPARLKAKPDEAEVLARGASFSLEVGGQAVHGRAWGAGPVVLLVHGWSGGLSQLTPFVDPLLTQGYRVVGFDWPGHGLSEGSSSSIAHVLPVFERLRSLIGPVHGVVAHSFGAAAVTVGLARGVLNAERLVFLAPAPRLDTYFTRFSTAFDMSSARREGFVSETERWLNAPVADFESLPKARLLKQPLLIAHSTDDAEVSIDDAVTLHEAWVGSQFEALSGLGHRRLLRATKVIDRSVSFLQG